MRGTIAAKDYKSAIRIYNNKGLQRIVEQNLGYSPMQYRRKLLTFWLHLKKLKRF